MKVTTKGYIEVWWMTPAVDQFISRHRDELEALESATTHAATQVGEQTYELRYPNKIVKVIGVLNDGSDVIPPTAPPGLATLEVTATTVTLTWTESTDSVGVTGYQVFRDGSPRPSTEATQFTDTGLSALSTYTYTVSAFDAAGNVSAASDSIEVTTLSAIAPTWDVPAQSLVVASSYSLLLSSVCSGAAALTFSQVSGSLPTGLSFNPGAGIVNGTPTTVGSYAVVFRANDGTQTSDETITFTVSNADITAPSVPGSLAASSVGRSQVTLTWTASTDPTVTNAVTSGLSGYRVYRDGALRATLANVLTYSDSGLSAGTAYSYTVAAFDVAGNASAQSAAVIATTLSSNVAPVWTTGTALSIAAGGSQVVAATDADGDTLTYSAALLPSGFSFSETTRRLTTSGSATVGTEYEVVLDVDDGVNTGTALEALALPLNIGDWSAAFGTASLNTIGSSGNRPWESTSDIDQGSLAAVSVTGNGSVATCTRTAHGYTSITTVRFEGMTGALAGLNGTTEGVVAVLDVDRFTVNTPLTGSDSGLCQSVPTTGYPDVTNVLQTCCNWTGGVTWDSVRKRISWVGGPAYTQTYSSGTRFISYDSATDVWKQIVNPFEGSDGGANSANATVHGYDNNCIVDGVLFKRGLGTGSRSNIFAFDLATETFLGEIDQPFTSGNGDPGDGTGMKFHPGLGAYGALVMGTNGTRKFRILVLNGAGLWPLPSGSRWRAVDTVNYAAGAYDISQGWHSICQYNPVSGYMLLGGGNNDSTGHTTFLLIGPQVSGIDVSSSADIPVTTFTDIKRADSPYPFGMSEGSSGDNKGPTVPEPNGRGFITFHKNGIYRLNVDTGLWTKIGDLPAAVLAVNPSNFSTHRLFACAIPDHDVIAVMKHGGGEPANPSAFTGNSAMWLYRA